MQYYNSKKKVCARTCYLRMVLDDQLLIIGPKVGSKFIQKTTESLCLKFMIDETRGT